MTTSNPGDSLTDEQIMALLPGPYYMDAPDGGDTPLLEQLKRMANDAKRWREQAYRTTSAAPDDGVRTIEELRRDLAKTALAMEADRVEWAQRLAAAPSPQPEQQTSAEPVASLPAGWSITKTSTKPFVSYVVELPNGYAASVHQLDRNPANVLFMLADEIYTHPRNPSRPSHEPTTTC